MMVLGPLSCADHPYVDAAAPIAGTRMSFARAGLGALSGNRPRRPDMTGILFALEIIALLAVAWWVYRRADAGEDAAEAGLLGMKSGRSAPVDAAPKWKASSHRGAPLVAPASDALDVSRAEPRWKTVQRRPGRPF
jgi:hypothetical protein